MVVLIAHLLKWQFQPERQGRSWQLTIRNQRKAIQLHLKQAPSLKTKLNDAEWLEIIWDDAVYQASKETGLDNFSEKCPWSIENILSDSWLPVSLS
jgi:predicted phage tail protein